MQKEIESKLIKDLISKHPNFPKMIGYNKRDTGIILMFYKHNLSYKTIGEQHNLSTERIRGIIKRFCFKVDKLQSLFVESKEKPTKPGELQEDAAVILSLIDNSIRPFFKKMAGPVKQASDIRAKIRAHELRKSVKKK